MNKIKLFLIAAILLIGAGSAMAQSKTGYISVDRVVAIMPETQKLDSLLRKYQADSLNPRFSYMVQEYNRKDSMVNTKDSVKLGKAVIAQIRQELEGYAYQIQNWQQIAQQEMQSKQGELLEPIYRKVDNAIQAVAKENGYGYVLNQEALLVMPPADDLLPLVAKKLNVKVPTGPAAGAAAPSRK
ncbi:OmpH family outer membrane protein [Paraflavisolibacter sp. H34]|uniref:OmpH family outer membrane protein n=1 Tax=Huijunlia imazamoxiresistens TaxID=3127457 RepID=UPI00301A0733